MLLLFGSTVTVEFWFPRGLWSGLKNALVDGQWCKVLSMSNRLDFFPLSFLLTQFCFCKVTVVWYFCQVDSVFARIRASVSGTLTVIVFSLANGQL